MRDNLVKVWQCGPKGKLERLRTMRLMSGNLHVTGGIVSLAPDSLPFKTATYRVIGKDAEGVPLVQVR